MISVSLYTMQVIKSDGSKQNFNKDKITKVVHAAGLSKDKAQRLADRIENWIEKQSLEGKKQIGSSDIRDKVSKLLEKEDRYAWGLYNWYEKTKSK